MQLPEHRSSSHTLTAAELLKHVNIWSTPHQLVQFFLNNPRVITDLKKKNVPDVRSGLTVVYEKKYKNASFFVQAKTNNTISELCITEDMLRCVAQHIYAESNQSIDLLFILQPDGDNILLNIHYFLFKTENDDEGVIFNTLVECSQQLLIYKNGHILGIRIGFNDEIILLDAYDRDNLFDQNIFCAKIQTELSKFQNLFLDKEQQLGDVHDNPDISSLQSAFFMIQASSVVKLFQALNG